MSFQSTLGRVRIYLSKDSTARERYPHIPIRIDEDGEEYILVPFIDQESYKDSYEDYISQDESLINEKD